MSRVITVGAAQLGPIARGCDLGVFPELALTTFFPRWWMVNFALHRRPEHYRLIVERAGAEPPPE